MPIRIMLNGEPHALPDPMSVLALLERLNVDPRTVAGERRRGIIRRPRHGATRIEVGAEVEIVAFVGGGFDAALDALS